MSSSLKRRLEKTTELLKRLAEKSSGNLLIIVEGRNDREALRTLAVKGDIITAKTSGRSLLDVLRDVREREIQEVILLMDFDRRGKEWTRRLAQNLEKMRVKTNLQYWNELLNLVGRDVKDIEGLPAYMDTLRRKSGDQSSKV
ncbi:MAG: toprim domain-containing protein [Candidatus Bathyarchaeota archaeon]|nr:MAG: toprim domain-containing protein [Candidatus Bathyarchaeota archaeon]